METTLSVQHRFLDILDDTRCAEHCWDEIVFEDELIRVAPTKGSIVPGWLLVIPKKEQLSFAQFLSNTGIDPLFLVRKVARHFDCADSEWIWFEHGAARSQSVIGCGVDYAHIHLLLRPPFTLGDFKAHSRELLQASWKSCLSENCYEQLTAGPSYYAFGDMVGGYFCNNGPERSQFFRKVVANLTGQPSQWDYSAYPGLPNVLKTLRMLAPAARNAA